MQVILVSVDIMLAATSGGIAGRHGLEATGTVSAEQAIQLAESPFPQLVAIDLRLPGLDIESLVARLRRTNPRLKIVAFAPHVHEQSLAAAKAAGCDEVFTRGQFERRLEALLSELKAPEDWEPPMGEFGPDS
jgi:CheY-like chemotaxis protein